jgi:predicted transcriptional regulator
LAPREKEVAAIVYRSGEATADQVVNALSDSLSNSAVRSMLNRLVSKRLLRRTRHGRLFLYRPYDAEDFQERALKRLADEYFQSSVYQMAVSVIDLVNRQNPELLAHTSARSDFAAGRNDLSPRRKLQAGREGG